MTAATGTANSCLLPTSFGFIEWEASIVFKRRDIGSVFTVLFAAGAVGGTAIVAQNSDSAEERAKRERNVVMGEAEAKQLLLLMDKDKNDKVSKQEFMSFMEAEFDRLDTNKDGELDVKELTRTRVRIGGAIHR